MKNLTVWIARDQDGRIYMHFEEPVYDELSIRSWRSKSYVDVTNTPIDRRMPDLTVEDGPIQLPL